MAKILKDDQKRIREDHLRVKQAVQDVREKRQFVLDTIKDSRFDTILKRFEKEIEADKETLTTAEKKNVDGLQARIVARRCLLATLKGAYEVELEEAMRRLHEFEASNELFIASAKVAKDEENDDAKTAAGN